MLAIVETLVGSYELTQLLGVKRARVYQISSADDFPQPAAVLAMGSIWRLDDIKEWAQRKGRILNVDALSPDPVRGDDGPGSSTVQREALTSVAAGRIGQVSAAPDESGSETGDGHPHP